RALTCALVLMAANCASVPIPTVDCAQLSCPTSGACNDSAAAALKRGDVDIARCLSDFALSINSRDPEARLGHGIASAITGDRNAAIRDFTSVTTSESSANQTQLTIAHQWLDALAHPLPVLIAYSPAPECTPDADAFTGRALATVFEQM